MSKEKKNDTEKTRSMVSIITGFVIILGLILLFSGMLKPWTWNQSEEKSTTKQSGYIEPQKNVDSDLIVIRPGDQFILEVNSEEWSPMLDASYKGMHTSISLRADRLYKYSDGTIQKVCKGKSAKLKSDMYRIKTVKGEHTAVVKTAMSPINKSLYN